MDVRIPQLGESISEGDLARWVKKDGEAVVRGETILELATDKATMELAAESSGVLSIQVPEGATVSVGQLVARIDEAGVAAAPVIASATTTAAPNAATPTPASTSATVAPASTAASASKVASSSRPAPTLVSRPAAPASPRADEPGVRRERMTRLRRSTAERLLEAQRTAAILTTFNQVDMSAVLALRAANQEWFTKRFGVKLGFMSLFARAVVAALREIPVLNASIDGEDIVHHEHVHLGVAVQTERGLVVPVVRGAGALSLGQLEQEIQRLATQARDAKLQLADLQGGTFTVSNGGIYGSLLSTPILNPPQSGILGMHAIEQRPVSLSDGSIVTRPMMYVALSYDHRLVDGQQAVTFLVRVKQFLEDPGRALLLA